MYEYDRGARGEVLSSRMTTPDARRQESGAQSQLRLAFTREQMNSVGKKARPTGWLAGDWQDDNSLGRGLERSQLAGGCASVGCEPMCLETGGVLEVDAMGMRSIAREIRYSAQLPRF